ncbi:hypothetical protein B0H16DRAFT_1475599 [Mycena metata]|uniref:Uncharacterized protein n=1 Tax=Mycena metata TaxID=1033252 RepID=A0AAD7HEM4_9AGAR|nr:hypothetical protein B0H16DRAFT_1475599 [Mycena metata]
MSLILYVSAGARTLTFPRSTRHRITSSSERSPFVLEDAFLYRSGGLCSDTHSKSVPHQLSRNVRYTISSTSELQRTEAGKAEYIRERWDWDSTSPTISTRKTYQYSPT